MTLQGWPVPAVVLKFQGLQPPLVPAARGMNLTMPRPRVLGSPTTQTSQRSFSICPLLPLQPVAPLPAAWLPHTEHLGSLPSALRP